MLIDILKYKENPYRCEAVARNPIFTEYKNNPEASLSTEAIVAYVILLYSKDSILNIKPLPALSQRRKQACLEVGLDPADPQVQELVFDLGSEKILTLILNYLISLDELLWTELCILEAQIQENHRLRFSPIKNKKKEEKPKRKKKRDEEEMDLDDPDDEMIEDDSKYHIEASDKKSKLTSQFRQYYELRQKYEKEIFGDNEDVLKKSRKIRQSLESLAK